MPTAPVDMRDLSADEFLAQLGDIVRLNLQRSGACVLLSRGGSEVTILDPEVLEYVPDDVMARKLLSAWSDEEIVAYLEARGERTPGRGGQHG